MLPERLELSTSPLPRECSTTELRQHTPPARAPFATGRRGPSDSGTSRDCKPNLDAGRAGHYIDRIMDDTTRRAGTSKPNKARLDKAGRLAEALRENLRKRKAQSRARRGGAEISESRPENDTDGGEER